MDFKKIIKYWNGIIFIAILAAIFYLFRFYTKIIPAEVARVEKIQLFITYLFILDIIIRIKVYRFEYIKSWDFFIDVLSCLDILGPILKVFRIFRFARIIRFLKFFRLFRLMKLPHIFENTDSTAKNLLNAIGLASIIIFMSLGIFLNNFIQQKFIEKEKTNYQIFLNNIVKISSESGKLDVNEFLNCALLLKNIIAFEINRDNLNITYNFLKLSEPEFEKHISKYYFPEDLIKVEADGASLTLVIKDSVFYARQIEFYVMFACLIFYIFLFGAFTIYFRAKSK